MLYVYRVPERLSRTHSVGVPVAAGPPTVPGVIRVMFDQSPSPSRTGLARLPPLMPSYSQSWLFSTVIRSGSPEWYTSPGVAIWVASFQSVES